jgi:hypothetical protein
MRHHIFDLDHTVIDSSHRQRLLPNGDLDLAHWLTLQASRDAVMADRLLPFAAYWRTVQKTSPVAVCTSRTATQHDLDFLAAHGLRCDYFSSRSPGDSRSDAPYKVAKISKMLSRLDWAPESVTLYDDHPGVRQAVKSSLGVNVFNPIPFNRKGA